MSWILLVHILQLLRKQHVIITRSHGLPPDQPPVSGTGEADEVVLGAVDGVERADRQLTRAALKLAEQELTVLLETEVDTHHAGFTLVSN